MLTIDQVRPEVARFNALQSEGGREPRVMAGVCCDERVYAYPLRVVPKIEITLKHPSGRWIGVAVGETVEELRANLKVASRLLM